MTREEAIKRLKSDIYEYADFTENPNENEFWTAFDMAIKALEQTSAIDKVREEIAEYGSIWVAYAITDKTKTDEGIEKLVSDVLKQAKEQVLAVIDKYRAESEEV